MQITKTGISREALLSLILFLKSKENQPTGEEFSHPSAREVLCCLGRSAEGDVITSNCYMLLVFLTSSRHPTVENNKDKFVLDAFNIIVEIADRVDIKTEGSDGEESHKSYPVPQRIVDFISSLEQKQ